MDVEALAVSEITRLIGRCPHLKPFISTNDKTPLTDGHIDLYAAPRRRNEDWLGRVPVQVKGRTRLGGDSLRLVHPITRVDLLAHQKDSGVLYLVVAIDAETGIGTPYFALLSPFAIDSALRKVPENQQQVSVPLQELPTDTVGLERLMSLALKTRDQNVSLGFDPVLLERIESFTVHAATKIDLEAPASVDTASGEFSLVLNTVDGLSIPVAGELKIFPADYMEQVVEVPIASGGITYDRAVVKRLDKQTYEARLSDGLVLLFHSDQNLVSTTVTLTMEQYLAARLKSLKFFNALLETKSVAVGKDASRIEIADVGSDLWPREHLTYLQWLTELLDHLGVDTELIEPDLIDGHQVRQLRVLYRAFVRGEEIIEPLGKTSRVVQKIAQWNVFFLMHHGSSAQSWKLVDPFSPESRQQFLWRAGEDSAEESIPVTTYDILEGDLLRTTLNVRLESIVDAYQSISDFSSTFNLANQRVLQLIAASDCAVERRLPLLDAAERLNNWLLREQQNDKNHRINAWQIAARTRDLFRQERDEIRRLKRAAARDDTDGSIELEVACALLLRDFEEAQILVSRLNSERVGRMESWPIWVLWDVGKLAARSRF